MADYEPQPARADTPPRELVHNPTIRLHGTVDDAMLDTFLDGVAEAERGQGPVAVEVCTLGGDAEVGRRMVLEVGLARERLKGRRLIFIGKTIVYSAGVTIMSAFPREDRFVTSDGVFLIHCRQLEKTVELSGPMRGSMPLVESLCRQLKLGCEMEIEGFKRLIAGSDVEMEEVLDKGLHNWYLTAEDALERRLIAGIIDCD
ncbi:peptidase S14 [Pelagerythrobacter rhizovicinus]|uniref:Peptidase S14 n=1 Tax=Pelagerythrobacter rhizovicinus TaxID=2268576 RepID=A0A4V1QW12_9SPHN|nr:peptidase S14 [Pelagerythrobacter rhizovicinus]RXZ64546.1 peptidase S14 [Pelagerythrobacter rhizovicinus]